MNLREYQQLASRTNVDLGDIRLNLSHMILGIFSEQEEFLKAIVDDDMVNAREEQADQAWYIANYCTKRNLDLQEICEPDENFNIEFPELEDWEREVSMFDVYSSKLADYVKKFIAYGKPIDEVKERKAIKALMVSLTIEDTGFDFEVDLAKNIAKLEERFPSGYSDEKALNRNLDAERKILEG